MYCRSLPAPIRHFFSAASLQIVLTEAWGLAKQLPYISTFFPLEAFSPSTSPLQPFNFFFSNQPALLCGVFLLRMRPSLGFRCTRSFKRGCGTPPFAHQLHHRWIEVRSLASPLQSRAFSYCRPFNETSSPTPASETIPLGLFLWKK